MNKIFPIIFFSLANNFAQEIQIPSLPFSPNKYICYKTNENIFVDGKLEELVWNKVEWTSDFVDVEGSLKSLPRFQTKVKMLWDDNYFYVAAKLQEPDIWGTLKNRDDIIFYDNDFEVFIDPDGDTHNYVEFEMNALNTIWDLLLKEPYRDVDKAALHGFDIKGIKTGVEINGTLDHPGDVDDSWTVEISFPWEAFKELTSVSVPPSENDQWRVNFSRVEWKVNVVNGQYQKVINPKTNEPFPEDNWVWSPQGVVNMHYPEMWGFVQFTSCLPREKNIQFIDKEIEEVKWFMRKIYYKERIYFSNHNHFTTDFEKLNIPVNGVKSFNLLPTIECTTNLFEASILSTNGKLKITIDNTGLTVIQILDKK
jgi:hypothetical protein